MSGLNRGNSPGMAVFSIPQKRAVLAQATCPGPKGPGLEGTFVFPSCSSHTLVKGEDRRGRSLSDRRPQETCQGTPIAAESAAAPLPTTHPGC